jgi:hypothetical protein
MAEEFGFDFRQGQEFLFFATVQTKSGTPLASYPVDTGSISPGLKQLEHEVDHLPTFSDVKNKLIYTSTPHCLHAVVLN